MKMVITENRALPKSYVLNVLVMVIIEEPANEAVDFGRRADAWQQEKPRRTVLPS
ncbi:hypothetical protein DPMN_039289 [Dreissena polymorpha]|uniref:Uncharacterized protein n=1 Tax=Dreissena polymorpha TaxID=45954 RepID=A0A9D4MHX4_DREPO|nr:hypothetical protein DPMN_039289 [Dreissena polymorpha]